MDLDRDVSEFNGSQLKLFRIDEILRGINMSRHNLDLINWLYYLQDFDMELESVKKPEERIETSNELSQLAESINTHLSTKMGKKKRKGVPVKIVEQLNQFQKTLLTIYKASGLELRLQKDAMSGFGRA